MSYGYSYAELLSWTMIYSNEIQHFAKYFSIGNDVIHQSTVAISVTVQFMVSLGAL